MIKPLNSQIQYLKGIGPKKAKLFSKLGIDTIEDFLYYFPRRYEDRRNFVPISKLQEGSIATIKAEVLASGQHQSFRRRAFNIFEAAVGDETGKIFCVWFNQPYLKEYFKTGESVILYGRVERYKGRLQINSPEFEIVSGQGQEESLSTGRIVPVYSLPEIITQRAFRKIIKHLIDEYVPAISDFLPYDIRSRNNLLNLAKSLINIHFPRDPDLQKQAYQRLAFEEFFLFQLPLALRKLNKEKKIGIAHNVGAGLAKEFINSLPFELTIAQQEALAQIKSDMASLKPMQRLLEGDVGSGKTVVATIAALFAIQGGYQAGFMVPTEILARQHYANIDAGFSMLDTREKQIKVALLASSLNKKQKEKIYQEIKEGKIDLVIGTHALLEEKIIFKRLGLVIIDEQHKFGVGQRALLPQKGPNPDILIMTATPIPRTLAITLYGDLDISVISQLPPGRLPVKTMHFSEEEKDKAYNLAKEELKKGNQAYIIYPVIEESYALDIAGAKKMYEQLKKNEFREFRIGLIHGRLAQEEQDEVMLGFKNKELDILVSTTVLEVGIDVPTATVMIVEHAQRFGLAQLHQLRGRVGRGLSGSWCVLVSGAATAQSKARLEAMLKYSDGFRIAEEDLKIRGPGEFFGRRQHGLSELKIGNPLTQMQLLKKAREEAINLVRLDARLTGRSHSGLREKLLQRFPEYEKLMVVG